MAEQQLPSENASSVSPVSSVNLWMVVSLVFLAALIIVGFLSFNSLTGNVISEDAVGKNVVAFLNSNPQLTSEVSLVRTERDGQLYKVIVNYQGQEVPVYATLDGKYLADNVVVLDNLTTLGNEPTVVDVKADNDASLGDADAPITIIEFSDYQCPFCRSFWTDTYPQLKKDYIDTGKARLVFRDYPLSFHPMAIPAANAAECVKERWNSKGYFRFHDKVFSEENILDSGTKEGPVTKTVDFTEDDLKKWARQIGYPIDACLDAKKFQSEIEADMADGNAAGVDGTPAFFINGEKLSGAVPYAQFKVIIDRQLAASS